MYFLRTLYSRSSCILLSLIFLQSCSLIREDPTNTLLRQAKDLEYQGKFQEAEEAYRNVFMLNGKIANPMQLSILINQARFYLRTKNYDKAITTCRAGLDACARVYGAHDTLNTSFLFVLASAYDHLREYDKASKAYRDIIALASYSPCTKDFVSVLPLIKLGDIEFKKHNLQEALELYEKAYEIAHISEMLARLTSYRLAKCCIALGHFTQAEGYFKDAMPWQPAQSAPADIYAKYAQLLTKDGKFASAGQAMQFAENWNRKHKEYVEWYYARTNPGSRCRLIDKYTEEDYDLIDAIEKESDAQEITINEQKILPSKKSFKKRRAR